MDSGRVDSIIMSQESGSKVKSHLKLMRVKLGGIKPCYFFPDLRVKLVDLLDRPDVGRCYLPEPDVMVPVRWQYLKKTDMFNPCVLFCLNNKI